MLRYEELAARRFRQYMWESRMAAFDKMMVRLMLRTFKYVVPVLEQSGLTRRQAVEKIKVE